VAPSNAKQSVREYLASINDPKNTTVLEPDVTRFGEGMQEYLAHIGGDAIGQIFISKPFLGRLT
jgi:hypothetical protein